MGEASQEPKTHELGRIYEHIPRGGSRTLFRPGWGLLFEDFSNEISPLLPHIDTIISTDPTHDIDNPLFISKTVKEYLMRSTPHDNLETKYDSSADCLNVTFDWKGKGKAIKFYRKDMASPEFTDKKYAMILFGSPGSPPEGITSVRSNNDEAVQFHTKILQSVEEGGLVGTSGWMADFLFPPCTDWSFYGYQHLLRYRHVGDHIFRKEKEYEWPEFQRRRIAAITLGLPSRAIALGLIGYMPLELKDKDGNIYFIYDSWIRSKEDWYRKIVNSNGSTVKEASFNEVKASCLDSVVDFLKVLQTSDLSIGEKRHFIQFVTDHTIAMLTAGGQLTTENIKKFAWSAWTVIPQTNVYDYNAITKEITDGFLTLDEYLQLVGQVKSKMDEAFQQA